MARYPTLQWMHLYVFQLTLVCFAVRSSEVLSAGGGEFELGCGWILCVGQNSMNQTLIVSSPQETIRCLTNHVSVFLPTPSPFTQLCSLINVWWKWWETDGHSLPLLSVHTDQSPLPDHTKCTVNCPFTLMPSLCYDIGSSNPEETRNQTSRACI